MSIIPEDKIRKAIKASNKEQKLITLLAEFRASDKTEETMAIMDEILKLFKL